MTSYVGYPSTSAQHAYGEAKGIIALPRPKYSALPSAALNVA
jgi:hypothetical protein